MWGVSCLVIGVGVVAQSQSANQSISHQYCAAKHYEFEFLSKEKHDIMK
jgi:hypothetical protein